MVDGRDIGGELIEAGLARDCPRYSHGRYAALEPEAAHRLPLPDYCAPR
jgi:endonuclease YncB( thermonuclease family)